MCIRDSSCVVSGSKIARDGDTRAEREPLEKADEQENQRSGGAHGGQRPVSEEPPDDERVRGVVELLENLAQKHRQRKACEDVYKRQPKMAVRFFRNEAANTAHMPVCIGIYFMAYASCGLPHHVFSEYDAGRNGLRTLTKL